MTQQVHSVKEAAKFLGLSVSHTRGLARSGKIPAVQMYGAYYIESKAIDEYLSAVLTPKRERIPTAAEIEAIPDGVAKQCGHGHWLVEWNVYVNGKKRQRRRCKICADRTSMEYQRRKPQWRTKPERKLIPLVAHGDGLGGSFS